MAKISHLVVTYNHETHKFDYDVETTLARFPDGWIWNEKTGEWVYAEDELTDGNDTDSVDLLAEIFKKFNYGEQ